MKKHSQAHQDLIRRYLLWFYKTAREAFERIERKTTQLIVDDFVLQHIKKVGGNTKEFEAYIKAKQADELKLKYADNKAKTLHPQYVGLKNRLQAVEAAIVHFLGKKELRAMRTMYEHEFTARILQAKEH